MTKERKSSANWYIAATHYLTAGFAVPFIVGVLIGFLILPLLGGETLLAKAVSFIATAVSIWLGVIYSSRYLSKTYVISNPNKVVVLSTTYYVVIIILFYGAVSIFSFLNGTYHVAYTALAYQFVATIIDVVIFYLASRKFVKATSAGSI